MHIGERIKKIRTLKGLSQQQLADTINKTRALVSHIENTGKVNHHTLKVLAKVFEMTIEEIEDFELNENQNAVIKNLTQEILEFKKENTYLKELVEHQKKIISLLENKKQKK